MKGGWVGLYGRPFWGPTDRPASYLTSRPRLMPIGGTPCVVASPSPSVTLLRNLRARQLTNQAIELHRPLILQLIATLLQATNINASIHTLKSITHLSRRKHTLAPGDHHHRHLQARRRLIHIHRQSVTEERDRKSTRLNSSHLVISYAV